MRRHPDRCWNVLSQVEPLVWTEQEHVTLLTAAGRRPPGGPGVSAALAADSGVRLQEVTVDAVHRRIRTERLRAGAYVRLRVHVCVTVAERRLLQDVAAVAQEEAEE